MAMTRRVAALTALWRVLGARRRPGSPRLRTHLAAVPRMLAQGLTGRYPHLDRRRVLFAALGLVYVLSPVDLVPELLLPLIGLGDDALVLTWVLGSVLAETEAFLGWERASGRGPVVVGEVVT